MTKGAWWSLAMLSGYEGHRESPSEPDICLLMTAVLVRTGCGPYFVYNQGFGFIISFNSHGSLLS